MTRDLQKNVAHTGESGTSPDDVGPGRGARSGDMQGLSREVDAAEESVEELADEGQEFEAGILNGVEDATDHPGAPVPHRGEQVRRHGPPTAPRPPSPRSSRRKA